MLVGLQDRFLLLLGGLLGIVDRGPVSDYCFDFVMDDVEVFVKIFEVVIYLEAEDGEG